MILQILTPIVMCFPGILVVILCRWLNSAHSRLEESFRQFDEIKEAKDTHIRVLEETIELLRKNK